MHCAVHELHAVHTLTAGVVVLLVLYCVVGSSVQGASKVFFTLREISSDDYPMLFYTKQPVGIEWLQ